MDGLAGPRARPGPLTDGVVASRVDPSWNWYYSAIMDRLLRRHLRVFRCLLGLTLLAWAALSSIAVAGPLAMSEIAGKAVTASQSTASHCDGMPMSHLPRSHDPSPNHPSGHGCCQHGSCYCASSCSGIAGMSRIALPQLAARPELPRATEPQLVSAHASPALRPPIA